MNPQTMTQPHIADRLAEKQRERLRAYEVGALPLNERQVRYARAIADGLCQDGENHPRAEGLTRCDEHYAEVLAKNGKRDTLWNRNRANGMCGHCGDVEPEEDASRCLQCKEEHAERVANTLARKRAKAEAPAPAPEPAIEDDAPEAEAEAEAEAEDEFTLTMRAHAAHVAANYRKPRNEAQAIQSLVMPFLTALGYDRDNLDEVTREFEVGFGDTAAFVDVAVREENGGIPRFLIECKSVGERLANCHGQVNRYFAAMKGTNTDCHFAWLTDGVEYRFYSDTLAPNVMDDDPCYQLDMRQLSDADIAWLATFQFDGFDREDAYAEAKRQRHAPDDLRRAQQMLANPPRWVVKELTGGTTRAHVERAKIALREASA